MKGVTFTCIWQSPEYYDEVKAFWQDLKVMPAGVSIDERAKQLVFMAKVDGKVIGVSTAERLQINRLNGKYLYSMRMLSHPKHRYPGFDSKICLLTRDRLQEEFVAGKTDCIGMITVVQQPEMQAGRSEAIWPVSKLMFMGLGPQGQHVRVYYFPGATV